MTKFLIDIELDGYDTIEEMLEHCNEDTVYEALRDYSFMVISVGKIDE
jgi:hypothetical protein